MVNTMRGEQDSEVRKVGSGIRLSQSYHRVGLSLSDKLSTTIHTCSVTVNTFMAPVRCIWINIYLQASLEESRRRLHAYAKQKA